MIELKFKLPCLQQFTRDKRVKGLCTKISIVYIIYRKFIHIVAPLYYNRIKENYVMLKNTDPEKYIFTNLTWSKDLKKNIKRGIVDSAIPCPSRQLFGSGFLPKSGSEALHLE